MLWSGAFLRMGDHREDTQEEGRVGRAVERGKAWSGGEGEIMDGRRGRGSSGVWHHGGLEHRRT